MANLIDSSFFVNEINIPNTGKQEISESITMFVNKYEPELLKCLLGYSLWSSYNSDSTTERFANLINGVEYTCINVTKYWQGLVYDNGGTTKFSLIAQYIYWQIMSDKTIWTSGVGTKISKGDNVIDVSPALKMNKAWNEFSRKTKELANFLLANTDIYPEYNYGIFAKNYCDFDTVNDFGL